MAMTYELQSPSREQQKFDAETEVLARQVEELILANDPEVIRVAAQVVAGLPHMRVIGEELVETCSLRERIFQRLGRVGSQ